MNTWITVVGIVLAVLGALYSAYAYFDTKIFRTLTTGFTFGIVGGTIFGSAIGLLILLFALFDFLINRDSYLDSDSVLFFVASIVVGVIFGFVVGIAVSKLDEGAASLRSGGLLRRWLLIVAILIIVLSLFDLYIFNSDLGGILSSGGSFLGFLALLLSSFVVGVILDEDSRARKKSMLWLLLGIICARIVLLLLYAVIISMYGDVVWQELGFGPIFDLAIPAVVFSFLVGSMLIQIKFLESRSRTTTENDRTTSSSFSRKASWKRFTVWLAIGCVYAICAAQLCNYLLGMVLSATFVTTLPIWLTLGVSLAFILGEGDKLIRRPKSRYKYRPRQNDLRPLIHWQRFFCGMGVIFMVCLLWSLSQLLYDILFGCFYSDYAACVTTFSSNGLSVVGELFSKTIQPILTGGVVLGSVVGGLYGFGPVLVFAVEQMSERRLGQIGLVLTILGILVAALPSLFS